MNKEEVKNKNVDLEESVLIQNGAGKWDFYSKDGKRITNKEFDSVYIIGNLIKVAKEKLFSNWQYGVYNTKGEEIIPVEYSDIIIYKRDSNKNSSYIMVKVNNIYWVPCNVKGEVLIKPEELAVISNPTIDEKQYLKLVDRKENEFFYEILDGGIKKVNFLVK